MSDKGRALIAIAKVVVALAAGGYLGWFWMSLRPGLDDWWVPYAAGIITAVMVYVLLSKLGKSSAE